MPNTRQDLQTATTAKTDDAVLYASLELGYKNWLVTSLPPGSEKMSKRDVAGGDARALLDLLERLRVRAETTSASRRDLLSSRRSASTASGSIGYSRRRGSRTGLLIRPLSLCRAATVA